MIGFAICCYSLLNAIGMAFLDAYAEKRNPVSEEDKAKEE
jgi:hypothetical protein